MCNSNVKNMKAVTRKKYGSPEVLSISTIDAPTIKKNEVLVNVKATTVNRTDCGILRGKPFLIRFFTGLFKPSSLVPGTDFSGEITQIGTDIKEFKIGDRVWGLNDEGLASQAEFMKIKENKAIIKIPEGISYEHAVTAAEGAHYSLNFINKVSINSTSKVMVYGATGAIGSAAVQQLKYMGAYVTAVGNTPNMELIKSLGADKVYDYLTEDFTQDTEKYDFVFDAVGKSSFGICKPLLKKKGVYISSELGPNNENLYLPLVTKIKGGKRVIFPIPKNRKKTIVFMNKLLGENKFQPVIDRRYSINEIKEAYAYAESGQKTGNIIINY